jgi:hypothetical protein
MSFYDRLGTDEDVNSYDTNSNSGVLSNLGSSLKQSNRTKSKLSFYDTLGVEDNKPTQPIQSSIIEQPQSEVSTFKNIFEDKFKKPISNRFGTPLITTPEPQPIKSFVDVLGSYNPTPDIPETKYAHEARSVFDKNRQVAKTLTFMTGLERGSTYGTGQLIAKPLTDEDKILQGVAKEMYNPPQKFLPSLQTLGEGFGMAVSPLTRLAGAATRGFNALVGRGLSKSVPTVVNKVASSPVAQSALTSAGDLGIYNTVSTASDVKGEGKNISDNLGRIAKSGAEGYGTGLAFGGTLGLAGKGLSKVIQKFKTNKIVPTDTNIKPPESSTIDSNVQGNINSPLNNIEPIKPPLNENIPSKIELTPENPKTIMELPTQNKNTSNILPETPITKTNFDNIKTFDDLPKDEVGLKSFIEEIQTKQKNGLKLLDIDLQLFAEAQKRLESISKVYSNTFEKSDMFNTAEKDILNSSFTNDAKSNVKSELESVKNAQKRLSADYEGEVKKLKEKELYSGEDVDTIFGVIEKEKLKGRETGDYTTMKEMALKGAKEAGREGGRTIQAFAKYSRTAEGKIVEAVREVEKVKEDIFKQKPQVEKNVNNTTKQAEQIKKSIQKETEKVIDEVVGKTEPTKPSSLKSGKETNFPEMLKTKINNALDPKNPEEVGAIRNIINDLFGEAKENIPLPGKLKAPDESMSTLTNAYKNREYTVEIRNKAQELLKKEFADNPEVLALMDDYFNKGTKPPHSQKLLNDIMSKRLGGLNLNSGSTIVPSTKPNLATWIKDFYATERVAREDFIQSIMNETGLTGDAANSLKNLLDSKLHVATKQMKDKLLETIMKPSKPSIIKNATTKLKELTNIGIMDNTKFTNRISEKVSPVIKQLIRENNIDMNKIVRLSQQDKQSALTTLKQDVFKNTNVSDSDIVRLLDLTNSEFKALTFDKQNKVLQGLVKEREAIIPKTELEKLREKINLGVYGDEIDSAIQDAVKQKYGLPTLSNDEVKFITDTMDSVKDLPVRSEKYMESIAKVNKLINEKTNSTLAEKVQSAAFSSMLLNPASIATNVTGNLGMFGLELNPLSNIVRKGYDKALKASGTENFSSGFRTAGDIDWGIFRRGTKQGTRQVKRDMLGGKDFKDLKGKTVKEVWDTLSNPINTDATGTMYGDKFEGGRRLAFNNSVGRVFENVTGAGMKIGDLPFNSAYFNSEVKSMMKANGLTEPTEDILATAFQISAERTFKDNNTISKLLVTGKNLPTMTTKYFGGTGKDAVTQILQAGMNSQLPFAKTPANIFKRGTEYSPLGLIEGAAKMVEHKGNMSMMKQREIVDRLTRGTIGTGLMGAGYLGAKSGLFTGGRDENYNTERLKQEEGTLPDALNVGGRTYDLKKFQPSTTPLIAGSRISQGKASDNFTALVDAVGGVANLYSDSGLLQNVAKLSELVGSSEFDRTNKGKVLMDVLMSIPKQLTPSVIKKLSYAFDPFGRNTENENIAKKTIGDVVSKIPFASKSYPTKVDLLGNPIKTYDGNNSLVNTLVNPYISSSIKNNPLRKEALRLNASITDSELKNKVIPTEVSKDLGDIKLTIEQQNKWQKLMGDKAQTKINSILSNSEYKKMNDNDKAIAFSKMLDDARSEAKKEMEKSLGINKVDEKIQQRLDTLNKNKIYNKLK